MTSITSIPQDLHNHIATWLRDKDIKKWRLTCKVFSHLCYTNFGIPVWLPLSGSNKIDLKGLALFDVPGCDIDPHQIIVHIMINQKGLDDIVSGKVKLSKNIYALTPVGKFNNCSHFESLTQITHFFIGDRTNYTKFTTGKLHFPSRITHLYWFNSEHSLPRKLPKSLEYLSVDNCHFYYMCIPSQIQILKIGKNINFQSATIIFDKSSTLKKIKFCGEIKRGFRISLPCSIRTIIFQGRIPEIEYLPLRKPLGQIPELKIYLHNPISYYFKRRIEANIFPGTKIEYVITP